MCCVGKKAPSASTETLRSAIPENLSTRSLCFTENQVKFTVCVCGHHRAFSEHHGASGMAREPAQSRHPKHRPHRRRREGGTGGGVILFR